MEQLVPRFYIDTSQECNYTLPQHVGAATEWTNYYCGGHTDHVH